MAIVHKFDADEIARINTLRQESSSLIQQYGQVKFTSYVLQKEIKDLEEKFDSLIKRENDLVKQLNEKYGVGTLNLETGEFISAS